MSPDDPQTRTFNVSGGWGDAIEWMEFPDRVVGWKNPKPKEGDYLICNMQSGKMGVWIFVKVEPCDNPHDMFFATVKGLGYLDEIDFKLPPAAKRAAFMGQIV